jgi:hypothetical protein
VAEQGIRRASREFAGEGAGEGAISPAGERERLLAGAPVESRHAVIAELQAKKPQLFTPRLKTRRLTPP